MYSALLPHLHLHLNPFIQRVLFINFQFLHEGNLDTLLQVWPDFEAKPWVELAPDSSSWTTYP